MIDQLLLGLQALFLVLLYLFIWRVMRSASRDLRLPQDSTFLIPATMRMAPERIPLGRLVIEQSPSFAQGESFELGPAPITIGRGQDNAIALRADEYASGRHARIEAMRDGIWVVDLGSTNGTSVNGRAIDGRELLQTGDLLRVGETELRVER